MEALLQEFIGKRIDVNCGSNVVFRGEVMKAEKGILTLRNEDGHSVFVSVDKIAAVSESKDFGSRPGFIV